MKKLTRSFLEAGLIVGILTTVALIGYRLFLYQKNISTETGFLEPNLHDKEVTIAGRPHYIPELMKDRDRIKRRVTFTYSTNSQGLRNAEIPFEKPPGTYRILCAGECVTFGNGVGDDQTYPVLLEKFLRAAYPGRNIEVINAGVDGAPPFFIVRLLEERFLKYGPDLVVLSPGAETVFLPEHVGDVKPKVRLSDKQYRAMRERYQDVLAQAVSLSQRVHFDLILVTPTMNSFFLPDGMLCIEEIKRVARSEGIPMLNTTALFRQIEHARGLEFVSADGHNRLVSHQNGETRILLDVPFKDDNSRFIAPEIYAYFDDHPDVGLELSIDENHPNEKGHRLIAEKLFALIRDEHFLDKSPSRPPSP